ncbi:MAG: hypothetical protein SVE93_08495 [Candidatus Thermoplasmatota archaeon]|nr:hypothetical protein [Candidatus Thermoplasmatota archaeon]
MDRKNRVMEDERSEYERIRQPLDYQQLLFRQIERINIRGNGDLTNGVFTFNCFASAIRDLSILLKPVHDEEFTAALEKLDKEYSDIREKEDRVLRDDEKIAYWERFYTACIELMGRKGLLMAFDETEEMR